jgi:hypothetical protein
MATAENLASIYEDLNFPSASVFYKALRKRGIAVRQADVEEFVRSRSERQVTAPPPKYEGNIVAFGINHRWVADLLAFTSRPAEDKDGTTYTHVLLCQDIFSRFLWAKPLRNVSEATQAFENILQDSAERMVDAEPTPNRLDTDGGPEFANQQFKALVASKNIEHVIKDPKDYQALATLDRAGGVVKKMLKRRQDAKGGSWLSNLDAVIEAYNNTDHGGIDAEPGDLSDDKIFSLKKQAAEALQENTEMLENRKQKLEAEGTYRVHQPKSRGGLRRRIDANTWSREIHQVTGFPQPGVVEDSEGKKTLTKFAKPVPSDSSALAPKPKPRQPENLEPFAQQLRTMLPTRGTSFQQAAKLLKRREQGFKDALRMSGLTFAQFVQRFPGIISVRDGKIYGVNTQQTL